jgi:hypothetical protein
MFQATMCPSSGEINCIYVTPGICHSVWMSVWYAGPDFSTKVVEKVVQEKTVFSAL